MSSRNLTESSQEKIEPESVVLIIAAAAVVTGLGFYLFKKKTDSFKKEKVLPPDPPPIIIKTGSFIIDSVEGFEDDGNISGNPKRKKKNKYKEDIESIKSVFVNQINERDEGDAMSPRPIGTVIRDENGVIIKLWFQKLIQEDPEIWDPDDLLGEPDVVSFQQSDRLKLQLPANLDNGGNHHHKRKNKGRLKFKKDGGGTDRRFRVGKVQVVKSNGEVFTSEPIINGDEFYISLWKDYAP